MGVGATLDLGWVVDTRVPWLRAIGDMVMGGVRSFNCEVKESFVRMIGRVWRKGDIHPINHRLLYRHLTAPPTPTRGQIESLDDIKDSTSIMKNWTSVCKIGPLLRCIWPFGVFFSNCEPTLPILHGNSANKINRPEIRNKAVPENAAAVIHSSWHKKREILGDGRSSREPLDLPSGTDQG